MATSPRLELASACERCAALCCVATSFDASSDFAEDKAAGSPCRHLGADCRCTIHDDLVARGYVGCTLYECHGAGQRVTEALSAPDDGEARNAAFMQLRVVHELLWLLAGAIRMCPDAALVERLEACALELESVPVRAWIDADLRPHKQATHALLREVGAVLGGRRRGLPVLRDVDEDAA
jgi:hypothetical protein